MTNPESVKKAIKRPVTSISHCPDADGRISVDALRPYVEVDKFGISGAEIRFGYYGYAAEISLDEEGITDLIGQLAAHFPGITESAVRLAGIASGRKP